MYSATQARDALKAITGSLDGAYYSVGVEVPPKHGASFSIRYTTVPNLRAGVALLRKKLARKRIGMMGEIIYSRGTHSVSLGGFIRRSGGALEEFTGDRDRGAVSERDARKHRKANRSTSIPKEPHLRPSAKRAAQMNRGRGR